MYQSVCVTKNRSLGRFETEEEATKTAVEHRKRSGHAIRVFSVDEDEKSTGSQLLNNEVDSAEELYLPTILIEDEEE